ncbi:hypothetical protein ABMC89_18475 [Sulfitobacter sp. HNIBRBA3233]|uniref:hypothetical protein n=1 Tax=Sulfitobacter marinivivus TaxID=3158558 RepID=UPI0032DF334D
MPLIELYQSPPSIAKDYSHPLAGRKGHHQLAYRPRLEPVFAATGALPRIPESIARIAVLIAPAPGLAQLLWLGVLLKGFFAPRSVG